MAGAAAPRFAAHFPNGCPPAEAQAATGEFYRLVTSDPPVKRDWQTHAELGLGMKGNVCNWCGLSIYADAADARDNYRRVVERFGPEGTRIGSLIARLLLQPIHGLMQPTPNRRFPDSHHTWWPYEDADRTSSFVQILEDARHDLGT